MDLLYDTYLCRSSALHIGVAPDLKHGFEGPVMATDYMIQFYLMNIPTRKENNRTDVCL